MKQPKRYPVGTRIRLTGKFLRSTGQAVGGEGQSVWIVRECPCSLCKRDFVCSNQERTPAELALNYTPDEIRDMPHLRFRHFALSNVCAVGEITVRNCP
jgi:hypothetical protein